MNEQSLKYSTEVSTVWFTFTDTWTYAMFYVTFKGKLGKFSVSVSYTQENYFY